MQQLPVSEIFVSIQGEGLHLGMPSLFVRLSGCNLRCKWGETLCDTPYTSWEPEKTMGTVQQIVDQVLMLREAHGDYISHLILTGGEPTLHPGVDELCAAFKAHEMFITLETNGTIQRQADVDFVSLSPKLSSSTPYGTEFEAMHADGRINIDALRYWTSTYRHQLKFVIHEEGDEAEILEILAELESVEAGSVFLMPQGDSHEEIVAHSPLCKSLCERHGWRFTPRAHIEMFGNVRGT
jgi:7-carboxy-7-deazaguanine synthase